MNTERSARSLPGIPMFFVLLVAAIALAGLMVWYIVNVFIELGTATSGLQVGVFVVIVLAFIAVLVGFAGLVPVNPNEARALIFFGHYAGTVRQQGLQWVNPFTVRRRISVRVRNFETARLKVNDHDGNPVEIAAVVVWRVTDTAEALFEVDDFENFVQVQAEAALRNLATTHPYDKHEDGDVALRSNPVEIAGQLRDEIQDRLQRAGVEVIEARISHLAYAAEIANAMLRRQQANAVIAARSRIVEGAVSMVEMALDQLSQRQVVELDEERKATMVSNLLVVLCSEHETQPVVNTGSLYA
jgi:regulator of protease activity HflC (stomatin/prohibitin superfamily)